MGPLGKCGLIKQLEDFCEHQGLKILIVHLLRSLLFMQKQGKRKGRTSGSFARPVLVYQNKFQN